MPNNTDDAPIEIVSSNPAWPAQFEAERALLEHVLAPWLVGTIEHVGSTAVPGLAAKPIIDIMVPVRSLEHSQPAIAVLTEQAGYVYFPYKPEQMHWLCKPSPQVRTHHVHLVPLVSTLWHERLHFRDALRQDPQLAQAYAQLKRELAQAFKHDREGYTDGKTAFVQRVLRDGSVRGS